MSMQYYLKRIGAGIAFAVALTLAAPASVQAATTEILAVGTTAANSSDVVVASGQNLAVTLKDAAGPTLAAGAIVHVLRKDDAGQYFRVADLTTNDPNMLIQEAGTYRFSRVAGTSAGVFGDVGSSGGGGGGDATAANQSSQITQETATAGGVGTTSDAPATPGSAGSLNAKQRLMSQQLDDLNTNITSLLARLPAALGAGGGLKNENIDTSGNALDYSIPPTIPGTDTACSSFASSTILDSARTHSFMIFIEGNTGNVAVSYDNATVSATAGGHMQAMVPAGGGYILPPGGYLTGPIKIICATSAGTVHYSEY